jgi:hypothetical protein
MCVRNIVPGGEFHHRIHGVRNQVFATRIRQSTSCFILIHFLLMKMLNFIVDSKMRRATTNKRMRSRVTSSRLV